MGEVAWKHRVQCLLFNHIKILSDSLFSLPILGWGTDERSLGALWTEHTNRGAGCWGNQEEIQLVSAMILLIHDTGDECSKIAGHGRNALGRLNKLSRLVCFLCKLGRIRGKKSPAGLIGSQKSPRATSRHLYINHCVGNAHHWWRDVFWFKRLYIYRLETQSYWDIEHWEPTVPLSRLMRLQSQHDVFACQTFCFAR